MPVIENGDGRQHDKKALYHCCALGVIAAADGALYYIFPGPGLHSCGIDAQLFSVLVCTSRHDNDRIERGIQGTGGRCVLPCRRCVTAEHDCRRLTDSGVWKWRLKSNYPVVAGATPTAGGVVFFGDMGANFYALNAATGQKLWGQDLGGAIGGGVITYTAGGAQKVAVAAGFSMVAWPTKPVHAKVVVLGLDSASAKQ